MHEKIWFELIHFKHGERYPCHLIDQQRSIRKKAKITTLVFSSGGVLGWKFWDVFPIIFSGLSALIQLFTLLETSLIVSESDLDKVGDLRLKYLQHFQKLEELWAAYYDRNELTEVEASTRFQSLRQQRLEIDAIETKLDIKDRPKLLAKAERDVNYYVKHFHSYNYEPANEQA